jgi:transposase
MQDAAAVQRIEVKFRALGALLNERVRRHWAATEAKAYGWGGIRAVADATGMSPTTIRKGLAEVGRRTRRSSDVLPTRIRRMGGGRKSRTQSDPGLLAALQALVDPATRGDPRSPLRWTSKSTATLAEELSRQGHRASPRTVGRLLRKAGYSLQCNRKTKEGNSHVDRNAQFEHINSQAMVFMRRNQPVISVDTKKKELVGEFKNGGREWLPQGQADEVRVHDFLDKNLGKAIPYGVYDITNNQGWVSVGMDHDTAQFATAAIGRWWKKMGRKRYPRAKELLITADGGGSNGSRCRLWKVALQGLADQLGVAIHVCHFPPGTSKWNKIEHRMFCYITQNWRGRPLISHEVIVHLIANTMTQEGLKIRAELDKRTYPAGIRVTDAELAQVNLKPNRFHGDWNYAIQPKKRSR